MRTEHNKLVRDKIPEIIRASGNQYEISTLKDAEYLDALRQKLVEEATEAATASIDDLVKELADLYEVIDSLLTATGIEREAVLKVQRKRREERGGFHNRIKLLWTKLNN